MENQLQTFFKMAVTGILAFQLAGCGTLIYPERRGQVAGNLDAGIVILDAIGLLFFLIPGIIAFAVDFSNGCIYLPARRTVVTTADLKTIRFDPRHTSMAQVERIIKEQTGYSVKLTENRVEVSRLASSREMLQHFAQAVPDIDRKLAFNFEQS